MSDTMTAGFHFLNHFARVSGRCARSYFGAIPSKREYEQVPSVCLIINSKYLHAAQEMSVEFPISFLVIIIALLSGTQQVRCHLSGALRSYRVRHCQHWQSHDKSGAPIGSLTFGTNGAAVHLYKVADD
jgi:hypothetical protein